ncbi:Bacterial alpha-L-rhamnosidase [Bifidobacterium avesanii]|uniref:alpha-L-rhamnosidase n=1 Tax=Bifidobacterium avesanii TaxID=1798157 RepID=A0A7K3THD8_9BIFI|nr:Bacterial alpha-L-rhamnosidase [Bifidobacterium avesanii]
MVTTNVVAETTVSAASAANPAQTAQPVWSDWSEPVAVEAGLLEPTDWTAAFISPANGPNAAIGAFGEPAPIVFTDFALPAEPVSARLHVTAHGLFAAEINGTSVGESVLDPGWTSYRHRLRYRTFDVTPLLHAGAGNRVAALLGDGWWRGNLKWDNKPNRYGSRLALLAQLEVMCADGSRVTVATDPSWRACESAVMANSLYDGSTIDLRRPVGIDAATRSMPSFPVEVVGAPTHAPANASTDAAHTRDAATQPVQLVAPDGPAIQRIATRPAVKVWSSPAGKTLVDFGQNAVGWVRLRVRGGNATAGKTVTVRHAEVLEYGELGTRPLRGAKATDRYVLAGDGGRTLEPVFTLHGFRYAEVTGVSDLRAEDVEQVVVGTGMERRGWFSCSDDRLNRLFENVVWGARSNFVDIPTDCPQRDERLGWTGDIQVFSPTALYLFDASGLLVSWLKDLRAEQFPDGNVPHVVPEPDAERVDPPACAWGDAATIVPWNVYLATGDEDVLRRQIGSMTAWVDCMDALAGPSHLWRGGFQYGDWLDPSAPPEDPFRAKADPDVVATGCFARCAAVAAEAARVIGDEDAAERYGRLATEVRRAFRDAYVTADGRIASDAQTVYALAIEWRLLGDARLEALAGDRLAELVAEADCRIATGFVGTPIVCDALAKTGHADVAWRLLTQTACPSWLYQVTMGATTIWERWDSMLPDGSINPGSMTSFNHYALGTVADWMVRAIAGLRPTSPGWRTVDVQPICFDGLDHAEARHLTPYGMVEVAWRREGSGIALEAALPPNVRANVMLPDGRTATVTGQGTYRWHAAAGDRPQPQSAGA